MILILIASLLGYLIAICPCNTSFKTGFAYLLLCYTLLITSLIYHCHKIAQIKIIPSILVVIVFGALGGFAVFLLNGILPQNIMSIVTPNYFMEYFVTCIIIGLVNALGIIYARKVKKETDLYKRN